MSALTEYTTAERHRVLADRFAALIEGVSDWDAQSPVKEWKAGDIVDHLSWLPGLLGGMGVRLEVPDATGRAARFGAQTEAVHTLLTGPDGDRPIDTQMMGVMPLSQVIDLFYNFDVFAHSWDLAKASGQDIELDAEYAAGAYQSMSAQGPSLQATGHFGAPHPVADDASPQDKLLGLIGRNPDWTP